MQFSDESIHLDKESIKALSTNTRVNILKILSEKQQTLTDLSALLGLSSPTLKEHLSLLEKVEMIKKIEEGRKWKYYKITDKGLSLLFPERKRIFLTLGALTVSSFAIVALYFSSKFSNSFTALTASSETLQKSVDSGLTIAAPAVQETLIFNNPSFFNFQNIFYLIFIPLFLISLFLFIYFTYKYKSKKQNLRIEKQTKLNHFIKKR